MENSYSRNPADSYISKARDCLKRLFRYPKVLKCCQAEQEIKISPLFILIL